MRKNTRLEIRIDDKLKEVWKEASDNHYFKDLTSFITNCVNDYIYENKIEINLEQKKLLEDRKRIEQKKVISERRTINRSIAFSIPRQIQIIKKYLEKESFIDICYLENEIEYMIDESKITDDPSRYLLNFLPVLKDPKLITCYNKLVEELKRLGISDEEIKKTHFPKHSISNVTRKINSSEI